MFMRIFGWFYRDMKLSIKIIFHDIEFECVTLESNLIHIVFFFLFLVGNSKLIHLLHNSEHPTSVFSILDTGTKQIPLVADSLFDLLILKMQPAYSSKKQTKASKQFQFFFSSHYNRRTAENTENHNDILTLL